MAFPETYIRETAMTHAPDLASGLSKKVLTENATLLAGTYVVPTTESAMTHIHTKENAVAHTRERLRFALHDKPGSHDPSFTGA